MGKANTLRVNTLIRHEGKTVGFRYMPDGVSFIITRQRIGAKDICPLCKKKFTSDNTTGVMLVISNQAGVPNRFCHNECLFDKTLEYAFQLILQSYEEAKEHLKCLQEAGWDCLLGHDS